MHKLQNSALRGLISDGHKGLKAVITRLLGANRQRGMHFTRKLDVDQL